MVAGTTFPMRPFSLAPSARPPAALSAKEKAKRLVPFGIAQELRIELFSDTGAFPVKVARRQCDVPPMRPHHQAGVGAVHQCTSSSVGRQLQARKGARRSPHQPLGGRLRPRSPRTTRSHAAGPVSRCAHQWRNPSRLFADAPFIRHPATTRPLGNFFLALHYAILTSRGQPLRV